MLAGRGRSRPATPSPERSLRRGFLLTLGGVGAVALIFAVFTLRGVVASVFAAIFISIAIDPLIQSLQRRGLSRTRSTILVIGAILVLAIGVLAFAVPALQREAVHFVASVSSNVTTLTQQEWFQTVDQFTSGGATDVLRWFGTFLTNPQTWLIVTGGVFGFGASVVNGISMAFFVVVLSIYFVVSYEGMKRLAYSLIASSHRAGFTELADRILGNVGRYLSGMVVLALMNATYSTIILLIIGVKGALLIGVVAFFITIIPLIGTILTTIGITLITLLQSPSAAIVVLILMLIYMQVEAYILTPRVMKRAVHIPGSVVLISALAGGTLLGLPGALIGVPVAASLALVLTEVVVPARNEV